MKMTSDAVAKMKCAEDEWYRLIPPNLRQAAYKDSGGEMAWPKEQALQAIDLLAAKKWVANGVEVWLPTKPGPTIPFPIMYLWSHRNTSRVGGYPATARQFIENFQWAPEDSSCKGKTPFFNISMQKQESR